MDLAFEWDLSKEARNREKHGVSFAEAASVFVDPLSQTTIDARNDYRGETRYLTIGYSLQGRLLIVANCDRGDVVRIISARTPTRKERRDYEEAT